MQSKRQKVRSKQAKCFSLFDLFLWLTIQGRQKSKQLDAAVHAQRRGGTGLLAAVIDDASFARLVKELQLMTVDIAVAATARSTFQHVEKVQIRATASAAVVAVAPVDATILRALVAV